MILLDTHVAFWALADPDRLSDAATAAITEADEVGVAGITWYELAWLADAGRIRLRPDARSWLRDAATALETIPLTWTIAHRAADLARHAAFPKDPADRILYATAVTHDLRLVTKDSRMLEFDTRVCLW